MGPWQTLAVIVAGWMSRQQQQVIEYLREENRVLREKLGKRRVLLNDDQRRWLAVKAIAADSPSRAELYRRHQLGRLAAQGGGQALDSLDPHRPLAALDQADVRAMKPGGIREGLLGQTAVLPGLPDPTAEHDGVIAARHA